MIEWIIPGCFVLCLFIVSLVYSIVKRDALFFSLSGLILLCAEASFTVFIWFSAASQGGVILIINALGEMFFELFLFSLIFFWGVISLILLFKNKG